MLQSYMTEKLLHKVAEPSVSQRDDRGDCLMLISSDCINSG